MGKKSTKSANHYFMPSSTLWYHHLNIQLVMISCYCVYLTLLEHSPRLVVSIHIDDITTVTTETIHDVTRKLAMTVLPPAFLCWNDYHSSILNLSLLLLVNNYILPCEVIEKFIAFVTNYLTLLPQFSMFLTTFVQTNEINK